MDARKPSPRSPTRSSPGRSKAGSAAGPAARPAPWAAGRRALRVEGLELLERGHRGEFPGTLYLEGPSEALKAAFLADLRRSWARAVPESPLARVFYAGEATIEEILAAFQGASLFSPRDLVLVLGVEKLARSEKRIAALAHGLGQPHGGSCLVLHEAESDSPRRSLEPLRAMAGMLWSAEAPGLAELVRWGERRLAHDGLEVEPGVVATVAEACEGDPLTFFNELEKLEVTTGANGRVTRAAAAAILKPVVESDLPAYLGAVALGRGRQAGRALSRLLEAGAGEGEVLFALANLVGGALGGWAIRKELSATLRRRRSPAELARALDALYRAEAAWKGGRADAIAVLEQATREVAGG